MSESPRDIAFIALGSNVGDRAAHLDAARAATVAATAELDALNASGVDAAGLTFGDNDFAAIRNAGERLNALGEAQTRTIGALADTLAPA